MKGEYIWIVFLFLVGGCSSKSTGDIMDISVNIESEGRMSEYFQEAELFFLETNDQALISNVDQVVLADNRIVLLGNFARNVFIFNTSGKHIATIEASGKGPGEYVLAQDICIDYDKKELVLLASVPSKLMFYNFEGKLEREYGLENKNFSLNNIVVNKKQLWGNYGPGQDSCVGIAFWNPENERFEFQREATLTQPYKAPVVTEGMYMLQGEQVNLVKDFDRTIYTYRDGKLSPRYRLDFGEQNFLNIWMEEMGDSDFVNKTLTQGYIYKLQNVKETSGLIYFSINNGKGIGIIDKQTRQAVLYQKMKDEYFGFDFDRMKPVSDAENKYFGYMVPVVSLQKGVQQGRLNDRKELIDRIDRLEEDSNPVLFLYKSKK
ncbi:6-bladed beta-propeller [Odoribacter splanchnicus]|uniref:6-bladed beta-propeller n=1 Tax=Odoribacter splanchnicus TaxID=28118 RepID=UPI001898B422|nr:6-bladed beta-propeller [Odoribacter splanchnicus]